ncbi:reprolysin-like metallopeptidase [Pleionea litopenaei]|uniref:Zinc-dependent metalloprotease family protein n=1 Tax=Pleionea litopenaei TaxID=3070815 RepID=A0AA51RTL1_9GAMM|nr:zinc-dependent metalloprotease family protein [Pleionea sp. HL-JVS1]WMS87345.1 zinc-dependent metalloprotease family protein [Pleionea sp. HL-JVS1]
MKRLLLSALVGSVLVTGHATQVYKSEPINRLPKHLSGLPKEAVKRYLSYAGKSLNYKVVKHANIDSFMLPLPSGEEEMRVLNRVQHSNGNVTLIGLLQLDNSDYRVVVTLGKDGGIADIMGPKARYRIDIRNDGYWTTDLSHRNILNRSGNDDMIESLSQNLLNRYDLTALKQQRENVLNKQDNVPKFQKSLLALTVVDTYLLYTPNIQAAYPGELAETLMNHVVAVTNQAFVDSDVEVYLRLVGTDLVNYTKPSDFSALDDLADALNGVSILDPSLVNVLARRNELGADLVSMIRTHDLNERGVCGVAFFPNTESDVLINISNVGSSGGSHCFDTFTHEVGHNFGAGHQWRNGQSVGYFDFSGALISSGKFNTIMSSIGTGDINRNYGLNKFSNPDIQCAGVACGDATWGNNAETIRLLAPQNAALRESISEVEVNPYLPSQTDLDNDGVLDDVDAFPFDPTESVDTDGDGVGDNTDQFPTDPNEWIDSDDDGTGNNADLDDDNDGTPDNEDDLPLDPNEQVDSDGDGVGDNSDAMRFDPFEFRNNDGDTQGNRIDKDDDNDGVNDFADDSDAGRAKMFVVSAGNDRLLQYDLPTNQLDGVLYQAQTGAYTMRSDIKSNNRGELRVIDFSDVAVFNREDASYKVLVDRSQLGTNFPGHVETYSYDNNDYLLISHGFGSSGLSLHQRDGQFLSASNYEDDVFRDIEFVTSAGIWVASRSSNQVLLYRFPNLQKISPLITDTRLQKPEQLAITPQGDLLVSDAGNNNIHLISSIGNYIRVFITGSDVNLASIGCMEFGPDGFLYVCSRETNQILKFNGSTGAFIEVVLSEQQGLIDPVGLTFAGAVLDDAPFDSTNDSDGDGVINSDDEMPLDPSETLDNDGDGIGNNADTDDDNDQMPDTYETQYGFDPFNAADANQDADSDGRTNLQEYLDNTDPTDPSSVASSGGGGGAFGFSLISLLLMSLGYRRRTWNRKSQ